MKSLKIIIFLFFALLGCQANSENGIFIKQKYGQKLIFPKHVKSINSENFRYDSTYVLNAPIKIVSYIDFYCSSCFNELSNFLSLINDYHNKKIVLVVYGGSKNDLYGIYAFLKNYPYYEYPIFYDESGEFFLKNNIPKDNKVLQTFLVDSLDNIILIGNPFANNEINKLYINEINKLLRSEKDK